MLFAVFFSCVFSTQAPAQTQIDAVKMGVALPAGYQVVSNPAEYKYQPSGLAASFVARSGDLVFFVVSHDIGGGSINDIGASYDAYYRGLLGQKPASAYRYLDGHVLYQAAYAGPGKTLGFLVPEHKDIPIATVNLWAINDGRGLGIYFQCPYESYAKHKQDIEAAIQSFTFQGAVDKREGILLNSKEFGGLVIGNPNDPNAPEPTPGADLPRVSPAASGGPLVTSAQLNEKQAADQTAAPAPDAPSACAVSSAALDALASAAKGDCDLATFLRLMQNATPEERRLIRNFLDALRSKSGQ